MLIEYSMVDIFNKRAYRIQTQTTQKPTMSNENNLMIIKVTEIPRSDVEGQFAERKELTKRQKGPFDASRTLIEMKQVARSLGARMIVRNGAGKWFVKAYETKYSRTGPAASADELETEALANQDKAGYRKRTTWIIHYSGDNGVRCRDMRSVFYDGRKVRHRIDDEIWIATYNAQTNRLSHNGVDYTSLSGFAKAHYQVARPDRNPSANGWTECETEFFGYWISTDDL